MKISLDTLRSLGACSVQAGLFVTTFGLAQTIDGVMITYDNLVTAFDAGLDIPWLVDELHIDMSTIPYGGEHCSCDGCKARHNIVKYGYDTVFNLIIAWADAQDRKKEQPIEN